MALTYGELRSVNEIDSILASQWANGMLPQIRFTEGQVGYSPDAEEWGVSRTVSGNPNSDTSGITQPPNPALALWHVYRESDHQGDLIPFLEEAYEGLKRYHDFLLTERDPDNEGLTAILHPWASGTDNAPCFDELMESTRRQLAAEGHEQRIKKRRDITQVISDYRPGDRDYETFGRLMGFFVDRDYDQEALYRESPFVVQDVMFNSILVESISSLAKIAGVLAQHYQNVDSEKSVHYQQENLRNNELATKVSNAIREKLYDPVTGMFYNYDVRGNKLLKIPTLHSISPLFGRIADGDQADRLIAHLNDPNMFSPEDGFAVPTTPLNSQRFENVRYWRGPIWPATNWIVIRGVEHYDGPLAQRLTNQTVDMISEGHSDLDKLEQLAASLMEYTSRGEEFTTPSRAQYQHGWLWDSGFAAMGWRHIKQKASPEIWERIGSRKNQLMQSGTDLRQVRHMLSGEFGIPLFNEYFAPVTTETHKAGSPLGAEMMTWTAALFLDLMKSRN